MSKSNPVLTFLDLFNLYQFDLIKAFDVSISMLVFPFFTKSTLHTNIHNYWQILKKVCLKR